MELEAIITQKTDEGFYCFVPFDRLYLLDKWGVTSGSFVFTDSRTIRPQHRRLIYGLIRDISLWSGHEPEELKNYFKADFLAKTGGEWFSLSDVDICTARDFCNHIILFMLLNDVPCNVDILSKCPDVSQYVYMCLIHKKCCVCRGKAELHHAGAMGMGRNRKEICHIGMKALPLCRKHHCEAHSKGQESFERLYAVEPVEIDREIAKVYRLGNKNDL